MKLENAPALIEALCSVAEKQAFLFPAPIRIKEATPPEDGGIFLGSISFHGDVSGTISMAMPETLCMEIVSNILSVEEGDGASVEEAQMKDVMGELLNVLCGQFLTLVEGDKPVFNLSVPVIKAASPAEWEKLRYSPGCNAATIDEHNVLLSLEL